MASKPNTKKFIPLHMIKAELLAAKKDATNHDIALSAIARCDYWKSQGYHWLIKELNENTNL